MFSLIHFASAITLCAERTLYRWPPTVCGQRQNVHFERQPRPVYETDVGMQQISDKVILNSQIALIDRRNERQLVHVLDDRSRRIVHDAAIGSAVGEPRDAFEGPAFGNFLACVIKLLPAGEIYCLRGLQRAARVNHRLCTDHPNLDLRVVALEELGKSDISRKRWSAGMHDDQIIAAREGATLIDSQSISRGIKQPRVR